MFQAVWAWPGSSLNLVELFLTNLSELDLSFSSKYSPIFSASIWYCHLFNLSLARVCIHVGKHTIFNLYFWFVCAQSVLTKSSELPVFLCLSCPVHEPQSPQITDVGIASHPTFQSVASSPSLMMSVRERALQKHETKTFLAVAVKPSRYKAHVSPIAPSLHSGHSVFALGSLGARCLWTLAEFKWTMSCLRLLAVWARCAGVDFGIWLS